MTDHDITVLGAGVTGITAALTLQLRGHDTRVIADRLAYQGGQRDPTFASEYGAGAIHPHAIDMEDLEDTFDDSKAVFDELASMGVLGVRRNYHHWIDETDPGPPADRFYIEEMQELPDEEVPTRPGVDQAHGWAGWMPFAEMPRFMDGLYRAYRALGGDIVEDRIDRGDLGAIDDLIVNCTGLRAPDLFDDPGEYRAVAGHLVRARGTPMPRIGDAVAAYTYSAAGDHGGAYCFPRMDGLILGGSHIEQPYDPDTGLGQVTIDEPTVEIGGTVVPERVIECNRALLDQFGVELDAAGLDAMMGYRPRREQVRLELSEEPCGRVVHDYGHGGAGITMAWGSAIEVARLVEQVRDVPDRSPTIPAAHAYCGQLDAVIDRRLRGA